ncbi:g6311 [Coccomyxa elongata]
MICLSTGKGQQGPRIGAEFADATQVAQQVESDRSARQRSHDEATSSHAPPPPPPNPADRVLQTLDKETIGRKTRVLLAIATAGEKVEEVMQEHAAELDFAAVRLMEKRIEAAYKSGESKAGIQGLLLLLKRIRLIAERNAASPAERLLDDCLRVLANPAQEQNEIREEILDYMESAFDMPGLRGGATDLFTAAAMLAQGGESDDEADEEAGEQVGKEEFLLVTRNMLQKAQEQRDLLQQAMQRGDVDKAAASRALQDRMLLIEHLQEICDLADSFT